MDRETIKRRLRLAEKHVASGEKHVAQQRRLLAKLFATGADTHGARELLATFETTLASHINDRERRRRELRDAEEEHRRPCQSAIDE